MLRNTAGQHVSAQMVNAADGTPFTGSVTVSIQKDNGFLSIGNGTVTDKGSGLHSYEPTQAETDANYIAFQFTGIGAVPTAVQVYTLNAVGIRAALGLTSANLDTQLAGINTNIDNESAAIIAHGDLNWVGGGSTPPPTVAEIAAGILATPANKLATNADGSVDIEAVGIRDAVGLAAANLDTQLADIPTVAEFNARTKPTADYFDHTTDQIIVGTNNDKTGYSLTTAERTAVAVEVESHLLDEGDSQMLINAIVGAIGNVNVDEVALVAAIRADLERAGGNLATVLDRLTAARAAKLDLALSTFNNVTDKVFLGNGAHGGAAGTLTLSKITVQPTSNTSAVDLLSSGTSVYPVVNIQNNGNGPAVRIGTNLLNGSSANALEVQANNGLGIMVSSIALGSTVAMTTAATPGSIRSAVGLGAANLDTQLSGINTNIDSVIAHGDLNWAPGGSLNPPTVEEIAAGILATPANKLATNADGSVDIEASGIRDAVGLAAANLDVQLADINTNIDSEAAAIITHGDASWIGGGGGTPPPTVEEIATRLLVTPANKLATNVDGSVNATVSGVDVDEEALADALVEAGLASQASLDDVAAGVAGLDSKLTNGSPIFTRGGPNKFGELVLYRGDRIVQDFSLDRAAPTNVTIGFKRRPAEDTNDEAVLLVDMATGLIRLEGQAGTPAFAKVEVSDLTATLTIEPEASTHLIPRNRVFFDLQAEYADGDVHTPVVGRATIPADVVR